MKTETIIMPALWASAIINYDYSGLCEDDVKELNNYLLNNSLSFKDCLMCSEDSYMVNFNGLATMCLEYTYKA